MIRGPTITILNLALLAAACGGGGPSGTPSTAPATQATLPVASDFVLRYPGPQVFTVNAAANSEVPSLNYSGGNSSAVSPPLPIGLVINPDTGVISGTPTTVTAAASYTISVSNEVGGTAQASVVIEVNDGPFFYSSPAILAAGMAMTPLSPRGASDTASYTVTPPLPSGLAIDPATGVLSGTPMSAQPATYYQVSRAEALLTMKFGLTLAVGALSSGPIAVSNVSTLNCAFSGGFVGTYMGNSQANDEGLIAIAVTPDGNALARVLDLSDNTVYDSDGVSGLSANLDGSFDINFPSAGSPSPQIHGKFSGAELISGTYQSGGVAKPFVAARLGGSAAAGIRYSGGTGNLFDDFRIEVGVLDVTGTAGAGTVYQFRGAGSDYLLINQQLDTQGTFSGNNFTWSLANDANELIATESTTGLELWFGDPDVDLFPAKMFGCRLN